MFLQEVCQLPEKQWTPDANPVSATLTVVGQYSTDQYGFKQPVQLKDDQGVSSEVIVQTKYEKGLMTSNMVGIRARWRLKWYQGGQKQVIVGYCLDKMPQAPVNQPTSPNAIYEQPAPLQAQQAASALPQTPSARNKQNGQPDWDAIAEGKVRHGIVCAIMSAGSVPDYEYVEKWVKYVMTGQVVPEAAVNPDDIPF